MAESTAIEWCDSTFNPWIGCTKVSPACDHCYAARSTPARTLGVAWGPGQERYRTTSITWGLPVAWQRQAEAFKAQHGRRRRVFCASLADVFDNEVPVQWRRDLFDLISATPDLDWLLLTKRIGNVRNLYAEAYLDSARALPPNVWLGATICNQAEADRDVPKLLATLAAVRFLSIEPMLGPIDLQTIYNTDLGEGQPYLHPLFGRVSDGHGDSCSTPGIDWVICGGESGPNARPMHPNWARSLRDQCAAAGVPFLFKQWGEWHSAMGDTSQRRKAVSLHDGSAFDIDVGERPRMFEMLDRCQMHRVGKKAAGRLLDGRTHDEFPR